MESFCKACKKGHCYGVFDDKTIFVHHIAGKHCVKELIGDLVKEFKTNHVVFTPLINHNIENKIRGEIKIISKDNPQNPYGEDIRIMECFWECEK